MTIRRDILFTQPVHRLSIEFLSGFHEAKFLVLSVSLSYFPLISSKIKISFLVLTIFSDRVNHSCLKVVSIDKNCHCERRYSITLRKLECHSDLAPELYFYMLELHHIFLIHQEPMICYSTSRHC